MKLRLNSKVIVLNREVTTCYPHKSSEGSYSRVTFMLGSGIVCETVRVENCPLDSFLQIIYMKQSWTCAVDQNSLFCTVLPVFETVPLLLL